MSPTTRDLAPLSNEAAITLENGSANHQLWTPSRRKRIPLISAEAEHIRSRNSRSFDSGISYLLSEPTSHHEISSNSNYDQGESLSVMGSPLISSRYSNYLSTPGPTSSSSASTSPVPPPLRSPYGNGMHGIGGGGCTPVFQQSMSTTHAHAPLGSPTFKKPTGGGFFISRRFSDMAPTSLSPSHSSYGMDPYAISRTLSPLSSAVPLPPQSPSPCYSSRSSPIHQRHRRDSSPLHSSASHGGVLPSSNSMHFNSNSEDSSPQNGHSPNGISPTTPASLSSNLAPSPSTSSSSCSIMRNSSGRRMLPETPITPSLEYPLSPSFSCTRGGTSTTTTAAVPGTLPLSPSTSSRPQRHFSNHFAQRNDQPPPPLADGGRTLAWQSLPSHDSLDSGVYSRSTTSDSNNGGGARNIVSPNAGVSSRDLSPPSYMRPHYRRGARLPEPPTTSPSPMTTSARTLTASNHHDYSSPLFSRRSSAPNKSSSHGGKHSDCNGLDAAAAAASSPHRAYSRHYYHYRRYSFSSETGSGEGGRSELPTTHLRRSEGAFSPSSRSYPSHNHRVQFDAFKEDEDDSAAATTPTTASSYYSRPAGGSLSSLRSRLRLAQRYSLPLSSSPYCDYSFSAVDGAAADEAHAPVYDDEATDAAADKEEEQRDTYNSSPSPPIPGAMADEYTGEFIYARENTAEEDEELLVNDDDDDALFVDDDGCTIISDYSTLPPTLTNPMVPSPPPEALRKSSNREIVQIVNRRIRAMLSQDYNAAAAAEVTPSSFAVLHPHHHPPPPPARTVLEVPKLRDLRSHSFPPPWSRLEEEEEHETVPLDYAELEYQDHVLPFNGMDPLFAAVGPAMTSSSEVASRLASSLHESSMSPPLDYAEADERRRRWLLFNHTISCSGEEGGMEDERGRITEDSAAATSTIG
jgi:hypothetical protein